MKKYRRISINGLPLKETTQDLYGYHTLRILRRCCRPIFSESAADELAEILNLGQRNVVIVHLDHITLPLQGFLGHYRAAEEAEARTEIVGVR